MTISKYSHSPEFIPEKVGNEEHKVVREMEKAPSKGPFALAPFTQPLFDKAHEEIFQGTSYHEKSYQDSIKEFRQKVQSQEKNIGERERSLAHQIMTQSLVTVGQEMMGRHIPLEENFKEPLSERLKLDRKLVEKRNRPEEVEGFFHRGLSKLRAKLNLFDSHLNGNIPFLVGTRYIDDKPVQILRHAVPTVESFTDGVQIAEEYKAFIADCRVKGKKVLFCSLLNPKSLNPFKGDLVQDERLRLEKLCELANEEVDTFHLIRFPMDGKLRHVDRFVTLESYSHAISKEVEKSLVSKKPLDEGSFIFSSGVKNVVARDYLKILRFTEEQMKKVYPEVEINSEEAKQAFLILFSTLLKNAVIKELEINYYNNTCKDAIDRGAVHLIADILWDNFLTGTLEENRKVTRTLYSWPAFMAKTQAVLEKRGKWAESFAKWIERASNLGLQEKISESYQKDLGIKVSQNMKFHQEHVMTNSERVRHNLSQYADAQPEKFQIIEKVDLTSAATETEKLNIGDLFASQKEKTISAVIYKSFEVLKQMVGLSSQPQKKVIHLCSKLTSSGAFASAYSEILNRYKEVDKNISFASGPSEYEVQKLDSGKWAFTAKGGKFAVIDEKIGAEVGFLKAETQFTFSEEDLQKQENLSEFSLKADVKVSAQITS